MRPLVTLLIAVTSLLSITGIVIASEDRETASIPDKAIAIWNADDSESSAESARESQDLARYARLDNANLRDALAVDQPSNTHLPLAITTFSSNE